MTTSDVSVFLLGMCAGGALIWMGVIIGEWRK